MVCVHTATAQVGIGTTTPDPNAVLDLNGGTNKGLLLPRITNAQMIGMSTAPNGMIIYNTSDNFLYVRKNSTWQKVYDNTNSFSLPYIGSMSSASDNAVFLTNGLGNGLAAQSLGSGYGLYGYSASNYGVYGETTSGTAGYFNAIGSNGTGLVVANGRTGLGTSGPAAQLHVVSSAGEVARFDGPNPFMTFYNNGNYRGYIYHNGTSFALGTASGVGGPVSIAPQSATTATFATNGALGLGVATPTLGLLQTRGALGAVAALFGDNTSGVAIENNYPGIGFNTYYSGGRKAISTGFGAYMGLDPTSGLITIASTTTSITGAGTSAPITTKMVIKANGNIGIEGNTNPNAPLSFANTVGNKIALWGDASGVHYGIGIQGALLQLYTSNSSSDIAFGYGSSTSFTERYRFSNTDNMFYLKNSRMRFTGEYNTTSHFPAGIEFTDAAGTNLKTFVGMYNDDNLGIYGFAGGGWYSLFANNATGNVGIGVLPNSTAKLKVDNGGGTSVELAGPMKVSGSYPTAFVVTASAANLTDNFDPIINYVPPKSDYYMSVIIDNAVCNGDPNAILLVTQRAYPGNASPLSVYYDGTLAKWKISINPNDMERTTCYGMASPTDGCGGGYVKAVMPWSANKLVAGDSFNVMVIKR